MGRRTSEELWADRKPPKKRGEGSVFEIVVNGQVKYRATRTLYMDENGVAVQVSGTGNSEQEAITRRNDNWMKRLVQLGELPASAMGSKPKELKMTTEEMFKKWLIWKSIQTSKKHRVTATVVAQYESIIRLHVVPAIGNRPVRLVTKEDLETFLFKTLPAKKKFRKSSDGVLVKTEASLLGLSKLRAIQAVVNMAFRWALETKLILENPTIGIPQFDKPESPAVEEKLEDRLWYPKRLAQYLDGHPDEARWMLMLSCGLRASEKLGAEWDCFKNLEGKKLATFEVRQQLAVDPATRKLYIEKSAKTPAGQRIVPVDQRIVQILLNYKKQQDEWKKSPDWNPPEGMENLVFTTRDGKPIRHQTDTKQWRAMLKSFDLDFVRQHAMRHIAISAMVKIGQPIEIIRTIAGHQSEAITRATYTHVSASTKMQVISAFADFIFDDKERKERKNAKASN